MSKASRYPLIEEVDLKSSMPDTFDLFRNEQFSFFLDSGMDPHKLGRYSFIGSNPFLVIRSRGTETTLRRGTEKSRLGGSPLDTLSNLLEVYRLDSGPSPVPFIGGAVGYLSYDLCHFIERLPETAVDDLKLPECYFGFYDLILSFDNLRSKAYIISTGFPELIEEKRRKRAVERLSEVKAKLAKAPGPGQEPPPITTPPSTETVKLKGGFTHSEYIKAVEKARQYIIAGDIFEVNLSQRFEAELRVAPYELYKRLRRINPAPFACYLGFNEITVVSASPERFLRLRGDRAETRPIKGTRPRGKTPEEDKALAIELLNSTKERAENIMIVDLERNDLGRVCRFGTVKVTELVILEMFPTVFHLTSTVEGRLREGKNGIDLIKATFPGGSITGAPKIRSMEIIDELEPTRRGPYTGNIGYLSFNGDLDLNIVIRTFLVKGSKSYFQVGGAIVYDSDPEAEYQETLDKASALIDALNKTTTEGTEDGYGYSNR
ncbi:MAG: aminodeoxychorismate synthase component I [Dehalococcoidales bacterium]|nr:aminodeoxychorismate synthase component I [Dehalococcoidales bacterium]